MARGEFQAAVGDEIEKGIGGHRCRFVHRPDHGFILMGAADREHFRKARADHFGFLAEAARHDHATVFGQGFANRFERFFLRAVEEPARVDQHDIGPGIVGRQAVPVGAQFRQDAFAVDERFGAAERNHADFRWGGEYCCHVNGGA